MENSRTLRDICDDINNVFEEYERDKKYISGIKLNELKEELLNSLATCQKGLEKVDSSLIELVSHLKKTANEDRLIDWEHAPLYNGLLSSIYTVIPAIEHKDINTISNMTYKQLNSQGAYLKRIR